MTGPYVIAGAAVGFGGAAAGVVVVRWARRVFGVGLHAAAAIASCVVVAALLALRFHHSAYLAPLLAFGWAGVVISGIDLRTHLIPTRLLRAAAAIAVPLVCAAAAIEGGLAAMARASVAAALGGCAGWAMLHLVWLAAKGGLGYGDVRLGGYLGMHLGLGGFTLVLWGLLAGFAIAALVGAVGVVVLRRGSKYRFALGPSLVAGALAALWWSAPGGFAV
ncbi:MAG: hypothetical protein OXB99_03855 [Acidimicrobiaceae bacterium]|nr:hypothetical protein [Acidimicrobiaceae bacterium]